MSDVLQNHQQIQERAAGAIRRLAEIAAARGSRTTIKDQVIARSDLLRASAERLLRNQFTLAVVGEFSRGKSSLINALLQAPELLPTSIKPSTAAITVLQYAPEPRASVTLKDGTLRENVPLTSLRDYCTAPGLDGSSLRAQISGTIARLRQQNRVDDLSYEEVERQGQEGALRSSAQVVNVWYPAPLLADGIVLVDTPGIGSVNPEHGEATRAFIHRADAVVFLINTDPVISASECHFLTFLQDYVSRFLFVITKIDRFEEAERRESIEYTRDVIREFSGMADPPLFPLSARRYLEARAAGDERALRESGLPQFLQALQLFLIRERGHSFIREHVTGALTHLSDLRSAVEMELQGMRLSRGDLERRLEATQPGVRMARAARNRILARLSDELAGVPELVGGEADILWIRLSATIRQATEEEIDRYGWDQLRQASELIPIFVRDTLSQALNDRLGQVAGRLGSIRRQVIAECRQVMDTMASKLEFQIESLRPPRELELHLDFDAGTFIGDLKKVGTITVGSTLALSIGTAFLFGGIGAVVMVGGLLAGTSITSMFKNRVRNELRQALADPLSTLMDSVRGNLTEEVRRHLGEFRDDVDQALTGTISNVDETLNQLRAQVGQEGAHSGEQEQALQRQRAELAELDRELSLLLGPGV
ncbi:MAG: dynamin family protein [Armatimonadetes bacterium]|nr:dynamin family protein [Armatimonadota bacterium]